MIRTPRRRWVLPAVAVVLYLVWPFAMIRFWDRVLESGILPPDADSVIIPMVEECALAVFGAPILAIILWLMLRQRDGGVTVPYFPHNAGGWAWTGLVIVLAIASGLMLAAFFSFRLDAILMLHAVASWACLLFLQAQAASPRVRPR